MDPVAKAATQFRSSTYRDRMITARGYVGQWELLIEGQTAAVRWLASEDEALAWLRLRVDALIAEVMFPGLRLERLESIETTEATVAPADVLESGMQSGCTSHQSHDRDAACGPIAPTSGLTVTLVCLD